MTFVHQLFKLPYNQHPTIMMNTKCLSKVLSFIIILTILLTSCTSTTFLQTSPNYASVYVEGNKVGTTPYEYSDRKIAGSSTAIMIRQEGYKDLWTNLKRNEQLDVGALIGGIFFIYPLLWIKKYDRIHYYELEKIQGITEAPPIASTKIYMVGEDDRISIKVDSIIRTDSLPKILIDDLEEIMRPQVRDGKLIKHDPIRTYLDNGNNYVLLYVTVIEKIDLNLYFSDSVLPITCIKDEFGKTHIVMFDRGTYYLKYPGGGNYTWNPDLPLNRERIQETQFLLFQMPRDFKPLQLRFYYFYRPEPSSWGRALNSFIDIDLVSYDNL